MKMRLPAQAARVRQPRSDLLHKALAHDARPVLLTAVHLLVLRVHCACTRRDAQDLRGVAIVIRAPLVLGDDDDTQDVRVRRV